MIYAKFCKVYAHAPLFKSIPRRANTPKKELKIRYNHAEDDYIFESDFQLSALDLKIFQNLVAEATQLKNRHNVLKMMKLGRDHRASLKLEGYKPKEVILGVNLTLSALYRMSKNTFSLNFSSEKSKIINPSAPTLARWNESIRRMSQVRVIKKSGDIIKKYNLLSIIDGGYINKGFVVVFNPEISRTILSKENYIKFYMNEVNSLDGDVEKILHSRLHWINEGDSRVVSLDKLESYIWGDDKASPANKSGRKKKIINALNKLQSNTLWRWSEVKNSDNIEIKRALHMRYLKLDDK